MDDFAAAIVRRAAAFHPAVFLEPIEQAGKGRAFNAHALGNFFLGQFVSALREMDQRPPFALAQAERAQALDFILAGEGGFNGRVGERGRRLSGGERQRLSIARALLKDPPILILDEATSALDAATETKLLRALDEVIRGRTTFVIAHRLATIRKATRILVFERGQIVEAGSFEALVALGGKFAELARGQFLAPEASRPQPAWAGGGQ